MSRADAQRSRNAILDAAVGFLAGDEGVEMSRLAQRAGVSRSTLYRHFDNVAAVEAAARDRAIADTRSALEDALGGDRTAIARLRAAIEALSDAGRRHALSALDPAVVRPALAAGADTLAPALSRVLKYAEVEPELPMELLRTAAAHLIDAAVVDPVDGLFELLTEPLDRGLAILAPDGELLACNPAAAALLDARPGAQATAPKVQALYEDGSVCLPDAYPIARALASGQSQTPVVRGQRVGDQIAWFSVGVLSALLPGDDEPYCLVATFADVTEQIQANAERLAEPGSVGRETPVLIDVARVLDRVPPQLLADQLVAEARRLLDAPVALYVVDIDGTHLIRLVGPEGFPERMEAPLALGPEIAEGGIADLRAWLGENLPGVVMAPMWLRGRAVGVLLAAHGDAAILDEVARQGAPAFELANGYTDTFDAARRRKEINPAAEIQQSLLPPRIARLAGGEIACGVLPSYETGGDWIDYVDNRDGAWIAIADAAGRGPHAAALGSVALAALRAARRNDQSLEEAVSTMDSTVQATGATEFFLTTVVARWSPIHSLFSWVNAGHPPPLLLRRDGTAEQLRSEPDLPLGVIDGPRTFRRSYRRIERGERLVLYTDGIAARPTKTGWFGRDGIVAAVAAAPTTSASATAQAIQQAVVDASELGLRDDAAVLVLAPAASG